MGTRLSFALVFASLFGINSVAAAADWTQFRGPNGSAVSSETGLPTEWSQEKGKEKNIRWKAELPGKGLSNPVIAGGRVYVSACSGYKDRRLHVLCFEQSTGKKLWERQFWATGGTQCHPKTNMAAPTPATDGERVYALFATGDLTCLDKEGNLVWYRALVPDYPTITNQVGMAASPILVKDVVIVPMENVGESFVAGIDKLTGQNRWKAPRKKDINWVTPIVYQRGSETDVLVQSGDELTAFDPDNGQKRWAFEHKGLNTIPSIATAGDVLLLPENGVIALRPGVANSKQEVVWKEVKLRSMYASPLYYEGRVYNISTANALTCVDVKDGKVLWQHRLKGPFAASPVAADGKIYCVNEEGATLVVQTGAEPKTVSTNPIGETILATPAIADGAIFLRSDQHLYCISEKK